MSSLEQVKGRIAQAKASKNEALSGKSQAIAAQKEMVAGIKQARTQEDSTNIMASYASIYAPFKGVVTKKFYETGAMASPGQPLLKIESLKYMQLEVSVPMKNIKDVHINKNVNVTIDALGKTFSGFVRTYIPSGDEASHTFKIKIDLPAAKGILPGMYGRVMLKDENRTAIFYPKQML